MADSSRDRKTDSPTKTNTEMYAKHKEEIKEKVKKCKEHKREKRIHTIEETCQVPPIELIDLPFIPKNSCSKQKHWPIPEPEPFSSPSLPSSIGMRKISGAQTKPSKSKRSHSHKEKKKKGHKLEKAVELGQYADHISPIVADVEAPDQEDIFLACEDVVQHAKKRHEHKRKHGRLQSKCSSDGLGLKRQSTDETLLTVPIINVDEKEPSTEQEKGKDVEKDNLGMADKSIAMESLLDVSRLDDHLQLPSSRMPSRMGSAFSQMSAGSISRKSSIGNLSMLMAERTISWKKTMEKRTSVMKDHIKRPPSPEDDVSLESSKEADNNRRKMSLTSFIGVAPSSMSFATSTNKGQVAGKDGVMVAETRLQRFKRVATKPPWKWNILPRSIDRQSKKYLGWLAIVAVCFLYNAFTPPLRTSFPYQTDWNWGYWVFFDLMADIIYLIDMCLVKPRLRYMKAGLTIKTPAEMKRHYLMSKIFKLDLLAVLPTDLLYIRFGFQPMLRMNRVFKILNYWEFFQNVDSLVKNPTVLRIGRILSYIVYMVHCNSCIFYSLSAWQGFENARYFDEAKQEWKQNKWVYGNVGNAYLRCFYFTTKVATSIGNNPAPTNVIEFTYMLLSWMSGVFVFALLLGQIRDIIAVSQRNRDEFRKKMDGALAYCKALKVPQELQDRVREWFIHTWRTQKTLDENALIRQLPHKLQTDLALSVHYHTLSKVQLFQDCDKALLRDLVLKLKPVLYLPGDYICKKGEVGKEMYIVTKGVLEVVGGPEGKTVFATLNEGSSFGEISLLSLGGGNRRTANVVSKGFSNLFVLSKDDLNETIRDYPEAQRILRRKAQKLINKDAPVPKKDKDELEKLSTVTTKVNTPRMLTTVAQLLKDSDTGKKLHEALEKEEQAAQASDSEDEKTILYGMNIKQLLGVVQGKGKGKKQEAGEEDEAASMMDLNGKPMSKLKQHFLSVPTHSIPSRPESLSSVGEALTTMPPSKQYLIDTSDDSD